MIKLIKWLSHKLGYRIAMVKIRRDRGRIDIDGDPELLQYTNIVEYTTDVNVLKRNNKGWK